ncbi:beta-propeller domain-containing protein [Mucilaginibacter antarcticus]|uniref:Arylsulfotransferase ASST n=2 Tax=Mucilaginibacter antarcticus TaxID=1855725 RepID=A0ABW5XRW3_9SPHI
MKTTKNGFYFALILSIFSNIAFAQKKVKSMPAVKSITPCMDVLNLFTAANVPEMAPEEEYAPLINSTEATPENLPGNGLAQHPMLYVGENCNRMSLVNNGKVIWTYNTGKGPEFDDVWMLSNGNILFSRMKYIAVITPDKKVLWRMDFKVPQGADHTEVHACQPIGLNKVMFVVNGLPPKLYVVNIKTGKVEVEHELPFKEPLDAAGIHGQFRRARVTAQGTYLISYMSRGRVVEYDKDFKEVWSYDIAQPWAAIRLKNGNTLITNEKDWLTREVNPNKEMIWEFNCKTDLPAAYQFTSAPQSCTRLANGNTIFTSRGQSGNGPQIIEVTRDKKVVWVLHDWKTVGDGTAVQILDDPGIPEIPGQSEH